MTVSILTSVELWYNGNMDNTPVGKPPLEEARHRYLHMPQHVRTPDGRSILVGRREVHPSISPRFLQVDSYGEIPSDVFGMFLGPYVDDSPYPRWGEGVYFVGTDGLLILVNNNYDSSD